MKVKPGSRKDERSQTLAFISLSIIVILMVGTLYYSDPLAFQDFLRRGNPLLAILLIAFLGVFTMSLLRRRGWFSIFDRSRPRGPLIAAGLASLFGMVVILFDLRVIFPEDTNVPLPQALLFYPSMGYIVEVLFHLAPLVLLLYLLTTVFRGTSYQKFIWPCMLVVAMLEPTFQLRFFVPLQEPLWSVIFLWIHLFLFNLTQLHLFRRYDFLSMFTFRLTYYLIWHIVWGQIRLSLLF